jgi:hercynylcysteine S-oxide lyase
VAKKNQKHIRSTLPTSHGFIPKPIPGVPSVPSPLPTNNKPEFVANFQSVGTIDNSPYLCTPAAIAWRRDNLGGEDVVAEYLERLAQQAGKLVSKQLGTEVLDNEEGTLGLCAFSNVRLPLEFEELAQVPGAPDKESLGLMVRDWISLVLVKEYNTFIASMWYAGAWWVRLSAQVYLDIEDFQRAADILSEICNRVKRGEFIKTLEAPKL